MSDLRVVKLLDNIDFNAIKIQGRDIAINAPADGQVYVWDDTNSKWVVGNRAKAGANSDIISLSGLTTPLSIDQGGSEASDVAGAKTNFGFMTDLLDDDTPQLGNNLDLQTHKIVGEGGSKGLYVDINGNVGIGTTEPVYPLQVEAPSNPYIVSRDSTLGTYAALTAAGTNALFPRATIRVGAGGSLSDVGLWVTPDSAVQTPAFIEVMISNDTSTADNKRLMIRQNLTYAEIKTSAGTSHYAGTDLIIHTYGNDSQLYLKNDGNVGIGITSPTAKLHLVAGTASIAPLKLTAGTNLTTPAIGAIEFIDNATDGHAYITMNIGGTLTRREIAFV